jgi:hypothetical protein
MTRIPGLILLLLAAMSLCACKKEIEAPLDRGVCWQMVTRNGQIAFNKVSDHEPQIESCAASLEGMRLRFLALGGSHEAIDGAYQGQFLFLRREGVFLAQKYDGGRYPLLVRTPDGGLAKLGAGSATQ